MFGFALSTLSIIVLIVSVDLLAAIQALAVKLFYVFVYTLRLKRVTPQNIVIGVVAATCSFTLTPLLIAVLIVDRIV